MPRKTKKSTRRGNKEGCIYQRKDGSWCGQIMFGYKPDGKPNRKTFYGETRETVAKKVSEATHKAFCGVIPEISKEPVTIEKLVTEYLWTFKKPGVSDVTFEWYLNLAKVHILPTFGSIPVGELSPLQIQKLLNKLHGDKKLAHRTVKGVRDILNQAFMHAVETKILAVNPVSGTKVPRQSRVKAEQTEHVRVIPIDDRTRILKAAESDLRMKTALTVLMFTGMRVGEFLALPWGNVDFTAGTITIDRAITHECSYSDDGKLTKRSTVVGSTKTQCSVRKFKAPSAVFTVLAEWQNALPGRMRSPVKHELLDKESVVFPNDLGKMRTYDGFRTTYRRFMTENSLGNYPLHSYRHPYVKPALKKISEFFRRGLDIFCEYLIWWLNFSVTI